MRTIGRLFSLFVLVVICASPVRAESWLSSFEGLLEGVPGLESLLSAPSPCPDPYATSGKNLGVARLYEEGLSRMSKRRSACEAAGYFFQIIRDYPGTPHYRPAKLRFIEALIAAGDYVTAINEANLYIEHHAFTREAQYAHYLIVSAVFTQIEDKHRSQAWTAYALGIQRGQHELKPFIQNLSFQVFLDRYPDSPWREDVAAKLVYARNRMAEHFLEIGAQYLMRNQYKAAISRFAYVAQNGTGTSSFEASLFYLVKSYRALARAVTAGTLSDQRLAEMLLTTPEQAHQARADVAAQAGASAAEIEAQLRTRFPHSKWTLRLAELN